MKIEEVRTSFTVYVIASQVERLDGLIESLGLAGYMVARFQELTAAFSEFFSNPPHFLLFDSQESKFDLKKVIGQVSTQLPESHIFLVTPVSEREKVVPYLENGVYDLVLMPLASPVELVRTIDRAAERDYFMYMNERLMQAQTEAPAAPPPPSEKSDVDEGQHLDFVKQLFSQTTLDEVLAVFLHASSNLLKGTPAVFFKYIPNRRMLVAGQGVGLEGVDLSGLGMDLNENVPGFRAAQLRDPLGVDPFVEMVHEVFHVQDFFALPVEALNETLGILCFLTSQPSAEVAATLSDWSKLLERALSLIEAEKRLHSVTTKDFHTDVLNRQTFISKISDEISRSRRTQMPVSIITMAVDQYGQLSSHFGQEEAQLALRAAARIIEKHSRVNDVFGRTGVDEFGLLLPHTGRQGAMVKAERLRKTIQSADFSKVLSKFPGMTLSLGVSEYPSLARDAEELLQSADEALYQVRSQGNKTCVSNPPDGFEPDFLVEEKGV